MGTKLQTLTMLLEEWYDKEENNVWRYQRRKTVQFLQAKGPRTTEKLPFSVAPVCGGIPIQGKDI